MKLIINLPDISDKKPLSKATLVIRTLKNFGIRGDHALLYFTRNSAEYLMRKCWLLQYYIELDKPIKNKTAWLKRAIENDYLEPEAFNDWYKRKQNEIKNYQ